MTRKRLWKPIVECVTTGLAAAIVVGCSRSETDQPTPSASPPRFVTDYDQFTNSNVPAGARQVLNGRFIKFDDLQVSRDGTRLLVDFQAPNDGQTIVRGFGLFDWRNQEQTDVINWRVPRRVEFSPDGRRLATIDHDPPYQVLVRDTVIGDVVWATGASPDPFYDARFTDDGATLVTASGSDGKLEFKRWNADSGEEADAAVAACEYAQPTVRLNSDATRAAAWMQGSAPVKIYDVASGEELHSLAGGIPSEVVFSPDGQRIATAGQSDEDADLCIWDAKSGERLHAVSGVFRDLGFSPDGRLLWTASRLRKPPPSTQPPPVGTVERNIQLIESTPVPYDVSIWDCSNGKRIHTLETGLYPDGVVAFVSEHELMTTGHPTAMSTYESPMRIYVWDLNSQALESQRDAKDE